jgi:acyl-CoA synthetase (AMP-forming)/AMP-acid ligase II
VITPNALFEFLEHSARLDPDGSAVIEPGHGSITYGELNTLANQLRDRLTGVAYVPVDPGAPVSRNAYILADCQVKAMVIEGGFVNA